MPRSLIRCMTSWMVCFFPIAPIHTLLWAWLTNMRFHICTFTHVRVQGQLRTHMYTTCIHTGALSLPDGHEFWCCADTVGDCCEVDAIKIVIIIAIVVTVLGMIIGCCAKCCGCCDSGSKLPVYQSRPVQQPQVHALLQHGHMHTQRTYCQCMPMKGMSRSAWKHACIFHLAFCWHIRTRIMPNQWWNVAYVHVCMCMCLCLLTCMH